MPHTGLAAETLGKKCIFMVSRLTIMHNILRCSVSSWPNPVAKFSGVSNFQKDTIIEALELCNGSCPWLFFCETGYERNRRIIDIQNGADEDN